MNLSLILSTISHEVIQGAFAIEVKGVCIDSRKSVSNGLFVAIKGTQTDGHHFIQQAIQGGCTSIILQEIPEEAIPQHITVVKVADASEAAGKIAAAFYGYPSGGMKVVAVTGTNGKTSVATLLFQLFTQLGYTCGLLSTVENIIGTEILSATHTTPDPVSLQALLFRMKEAGCTHVFMEASSHAIHQKRLAGTKLTGAVFTNITHDHLDYHGTFSNYIQAKKELFDGLEVDSFALVNKDDRNGAVMLQNCKAARYTFSLLQQADFNAKILESDLNGTLISIRSQEVYCQLYGQFNMYNLLAVFGVGFLLGEEEDALVAGISLLKPPKGRFDIYRSVKGIVGIVDYAHTPDALENILDTIQKMRTRNETLIAIVGCGGNRDSAKRPLMADIATQFADKVIFTSDNPRNESPEQIIQEMMVGVKPLHYKKTLRITDRREAIYAAVSMASPGDIILIAGKGHETYQEIAGHKHPFDDGQELINAYHQFDV